MTLTITAIPLLSDNYAYVIANAARECVVVDPSEAGPVARHLVRHGQTLSAIWCTHHHPDHVGGVEELVAGAGPVDVVASAYDIAKGRIPCATRGAIEGEAIDVLGRKARVLSLPGHTLGAIAFHLDDALFVGDTIFGGGCGRVFEGTMPMMRATLDRIASLDPKTRIYFGHEYTEKNLSFAREIEPGSAQLSARIERVLNARSQRLPTSPSTVTEERDTNPFLRTRETAVIEGSRRLDAAVDGKNPDDVFRVLREARNRY